MIARAASLQCWSWTASVCGDSPFRDDRSERAKTVQPKIQKNRCRTTVAEPIWGNASGTALYRGSGRLFRPRPGRLERTGINEPRASRLFLGPEAEILTTWLHWWTGVAIGVVTVAPIVIGLSAALREPPPRSEQFEGTAGLLALAAMTGVVLSLPQQLWETVVPGALLFPVLLWLAARCRPVFAAGGVLIVSLTIAWTTIFGIGHFGNSGLPIDYRVAQAQAVILAAAIGAHVLAALLRSAGRAKRASRAQTLCWSANEIIDY